MREEEKFGTGTSVRDGLPRSHWSIVTGHGLNNRAFKLNHRAPCSTCREADLEESLRMEGTAPAAAQWPLSQIPED